MVRTFDWQNDVTKVTNDDRDTDYMVARLLSYVDAVAEQDARNDAEYVRAI